MKRIAVAALALLIPVTTLAEDPLVVNQPWARASVIASRPAAACLILESASGDRLTGVSTPVANEVMIHAVQEENGVSRMVHLPDLDLAPGEPVTLAPGSTHLMLVGLGSKLEEGDSVPMTLSFAESADVTVEVPVLGIAASGPEDARR